MEMEEAICEFNAKFHLLRYEKGQLDVQMKLAKYRHITLFEELHILKVFEKREFALQERRNACLKEQRALRVCVTVHLSVYLSVCLSVRLSVSVIDGAGDGRKYRKSLL